MSIYRNAEGIHSQRKFGNPCSSVSGSKVMPKNSKYFRNLLSNFRDSLINFRKFGHNFGTRNTRKSIKSSKDLY